MGLIDNVIHRKQTIEHNSDLIKLNNNYLETKEMDDVKTKQKNIIGAY